MGRDEVKGSLYWRRNGRSHSYQGSLNGPRAPPNTFKSTVPHKGGFCGNHVHRAGETTQRCSTTRMAHSTAALAPTTTYTFSQVDR
jgi:hypothetical protein